jgi:SAM-dependent methyltransferase
MRQDYADEYPQLEKNHWWFRARRQILREQIQALSLPLHASILEVGVGPGENLYSIYPPDAETVGIEPDPKLAALARARGPRPIHETTIEEFPSSVATARFDAVTMFDLLEHTRDDALVLRKANELLAPQGYLVVSVPAFMFLWSQHDVVNAHYRRYTRRELVSKVEQAGLSVTRATYFSTLLFPPVAVLRILRRTTSEEDAATDLKYSLGPADRMLYHIFLAERRLLRHVNLPFGTSVLVVARKP